MHFGRLDWDFWTASGFVTTAHASFYKDQMGSSVCRFTLIYRTVCMQDLHAAEIQQSIDIATEAASETIAGLFQFFLLLLSHTATQRFPYNSIGLHLLLRAKSVASQGALT